MAMTNRADIKRDGLIMSTLDDLAPQDHLVRTQEAAIDWKFIYPLVKSLYSNFGRRSIDLVVLFKMIFINYTFGINSMRETFIIKQPTEKDTESMKAIQKTVKNVLSYQNAANQRNM